MNDDVEKKTSTIKRFLPLVVIVGLMIGAFVSGVHERFNLEALQENKGALLAMVRDHSVLSALGFFGVYVAAVALSLPIATVLTLAGGFLFGKWLGTVYVVSGATVGAAIIFLIAKTSLGEVLREKAGGLYGKIEGNMKENAVGYLLFMRLVPLFPFFLVNIVPALFNVRLRVFVLTTFFGILPGSFVFVNLGEQLGEISSLGDLVSGGTLGAFALLGVFALIPTLYKQFKARKSTAAVVLAAAVLVSGGGQAAEYEGFVEAYDGLLKSHVRAASKGGVDYNGVDYGAWGKDGRYKEALEIIQGVDPADLKTRDERMAYWINVYNFLTIDLIVREGEGKSIKNLGGTFVSPWKKHTWEIAGAAYTLDQIEHKILRPMGDARIHFAINCASVSCPDLRIGAYRAGTLDTDLEAQTILSLKNAGKVFAAEGNVLRVSKIFDWFAEDFKEGDVKGWLADYVSVKDGDLIKYFKYDWSLNVAE